LCILDGWGWHPEGGPDDAIAQANTPNYDKMIAECPMSHLATSGRAVGLPEGQMGNSEVGHTNIGAGRVVMQDLVRIDDAIERGVLGEAPVLKDLIAAAKSASGTVHLMGLLSPGGVHAQQHHIEELCRIFSAAGLKVRVHAFLDGRDVPPQSALGYIDEFARTIGSLKDVLVATVSGRYYAMDRDKRWERVTKAYAAIVEAKGERLPSARDAVEKSYAGKITDEFVLPCVIGDYAGARDGDVLLFANFRPDRAREISSALLDPAFDGFSRGRVVRFAFAAGLTQYSQALSALMKAVFPPQDVTQTLGEQFAGLGLKQLRIAETEKYAHVTFFFNGGRETQFEGEDRILVPSPKVATYDQQPEMSAPEVTDKLVEAIASGKYDLIIANYANPDMVGHTGDMKAAVRAVEVIDGCLGRVRAAIEKAGGLMLLTADHGNVEMMRDPQTGEPQTSHTTLDVPFIAINAQAVGRRVALANGTLADIAPTLLDLEGLPKPQQMTGHSLVKNKTEAAA
jgi:2,3-bisphosphoglycerate-independent phosphoglycerate mutase